MGKLHGVVLLTLLACGSREASTSAVNETPKLERVAVEKLSAPVDPRFDAHGALLGSGRRFAWLELPKGFAEQPGSTEAAGSFRADDMPFDKVRDYLDGRLQAEKLSMSDHSLHFLRAKPTHTGLALERLDVRLFEEQGAGSAVLLRIEILPGADAPAFPVAAAREELARRRQRAE
jgi:hypothetical protein